MDGCGEVDYCFGDTYVNGIDTCHTLARREIDIRPERSIEYRAFSRSGTINYPFYLTSRSCTFILSLCSTDSIVSSWLAGWLAIK